MFGYSKHLLIARLLVSVGVISPVVANAQAPSWTFQSENDAYPHWGDDDYTNGLRVSVDFPRAVWWQRLGGGRKSCSEESNQERPCLRTTLMFGQNFYTPQNITIAAIQPTERPYSAWLYGGFAARVARQRRLTSVELQLGTTGKAALGEPVQKRWHSLPFVGAPDPKGWANQVKPVPGLVGVIITWDDKFAVEQRTDGPSSFAYADAIPYYRVTVGNVHDFAATGAMLRLGYNLQRNWTEKIGPTFQGRVASLAQPSLPRERHFFVNAFVGAEARAVGWNALLQNDTYVDRPAVPVTRGVVDREIGVAIGYRRLSGGFRWVWRSPEFEGGRTSRFAGPYVTWNARTK
jgi:lipid A 3-O-deacylase